MELSLDGQLPRNLARHFPEGCTVDHVQQLGWQKTRNGALLRQAAAAGYDALISADKNMSHQQSGRALTLSVVVLHVYRLKLETLAPLIPAALGRLRETTEPTFIRIDSEPDVAADA